MATAQAKNTTMKNRIISALIASVSCLPLSAISGDNKNPDDRIVLDFTTVEKAEFLGEMRQMLASIQGIISGIGTEDRALIAKSAIYSGNRMARATPASVKNKLPKSFKEIGGPTHMMFEELAVRAETDDMGTLAASSGELMKQCLTCHKMFRIDTAE